MKHLLHFRIVVLLFIITCVLGISSAYSLRDYAKGDEVSKQQKEKLDLLRMKIESIYEQYPDTAMMLLQEGTELANQINDSSTIAYFNQVKGLILYLVNPDMAVKYFFEAKHLYEALGNKKREAQALIGLGVCANLKFEQRMDLLHQALDLLEKIEDTSYMAVVYNYIGMTHYYFGDQNSDSAMHYFYKCQEVAKKTGNNEQYALSSSNVASVFIDLGRYDEARVLLKKAEAFTPEDKKFNLIYVHHNMMDLFLKTDRPDSAFYYLSLFEDKLEKHPEAEIETYMQLYAYYRRINKPDSALIYFEKADSLQGIMRERNQENNFALLKLEYESKLKEEQLAKFRVKEEIADIIRTSLILLLILTIVFSTILIRQQKQKSQRKREALLQKKRRLEAEQKLLSTELEHSELKRKYLDDELKYSNKELSSFATNIVQNHNLLSDLKEKVSQITREKSISKIKDQLQELNLQLIQVFNNNAQRSEFIDRSRQLNHSLVFYLRREFPQLTEGDINLLILIFLKFSSKEISVLYNIEPGSVVTRRYRLRQKLGITDRENFDVFFDQIMQNFEVKTAEQDE